VKGIASVLIVDDDVNFCDTTVDLLNERGFDCVGVYSGTEAINKARETDFDVILMDIRMPVINGIEAHREIKKIRPHTEIIFVTAYRMDELARGVLREGEYGVVHKPSDIERVVKMIKRSGEGGTLILAVDDDPYTFETLKDHFEEEGFFVTSALNGEEAYKVARERPHEIIFIDAKLQPVNGLIIYLELKNINPDVKVVMMLAYKKEMKNVLMQALEPGAYAYLYKPFSIDEVIKKIESIISNR